MRDRVDLIEQLLQGVGLNVDFFLRPDRTQCDLTALRIHGAHEPEHAIDKHASGYIVRGSLP